MKRAFSGDGGMEMTKKFKQNRQQGNETSHYKSLRSEPLPAAILVLPHVVRTINKFLVTNVEAIMEAARTNQLEWLRELLHSSQWAVHSESLNAAAAGGHTGAVKLLSQQLFHEGQPYTKCVNLRDAVAAAAENGRLEVVKLMLPGLVAYEDNDSDTDQELLVSSAWIVVKDAAKVGHADVVGFATQYAHERYFSRGSQILSLAVSADHAEVVRVLLRPRQYNWLHYQVLEQAVDERQQAVVETIYEEYSWYSNDRDLFVDMACIGNAVAVKFLYDCGYNDPALVDEAIINAASRDHPDIVTTLHDSGRVSLMTFDMAFVGAAAYGCIGTVMYLYCQQRASPEAVQKVFKNAGSVFVFNYLLDKEGFAQY